MSDSFKNTTTNGVTLEANVTIDTAGIGKDLLMELVVYRENDGVTKFFKADPFTISKVDGNVVTYSFKHKVKDAGLFKYAFRAYPWNANLPHRQDFAYILWI